MPIFTRRKSRSQKASSYTYGGTSSTSTATSFIYKAPHHTHAHTTSLSKETIKRRFSAILLQSLSSSSTSSLSNSPSATPITPDTLTPSQRARLALHPTSMGPPALSSIPAFERLFESSYPAPSPSESTFSDIRRPSGLGSPVEGSLSDDTDSTYRLGGAFDLEKYYMERGEDDDDEDYDDMEIRRPSGLGARRGSLSRTRSSTVGAPNTSQQSTGNGRLVSSASTPNLSFLLRLNGEDDSNDLYASFPTPPRSPPHLTLSGPGSPSSPTPKRAPQKPASERLGAILHTLAPLLFIHTQPHSSSSISPSTATSTSNSGWMTPNSAILPLLLVSRPLYTALIKLLYHTIELHSLPSRTLLVQTLTSPSNSSKHHDLASLIHRLRLDCSSESSPPKFFVALSKSLYQMTSLTSLSLTGSRSIVLENTSFRLRSFHGSFTPLESESVAAFLASQPDLEYLSLKGLDVPVRLREGSMPKLSVVEGHVKALSSIVPRRPVVDIRILESRRDELSDSWVHLGRSSERVRSMSVVIPEFGGGDVLEDTLINIPRWFREVETLTLRFTSDDGLTEPHINTLVKYLGSTKITTLRIITPTQPRTPPGLGLGR
ncbi:hypothetical protein SISSUDRAFT_1123080, partial [Sistotremastrum suecicum HHB10207 ss-3]